MHPILESSDIKKLPDDKIDEKISELRKKRNMVLRSNKNPLVLDQIDSLIATYMFELDDRRLKKLAKDKDKGTEHDDLINVE
jgi:hypothetical protein|tara:strand:+ start:428 stop:673 length:246 start_codon:yes stop_codon:yes gene_type:complete